MEFMLSIIAVFLYFIQKHMGDIADELKKMNKGPNDKSNASQPKPNSST